MNNISKKKILLSIIIILFLVGCSKDEKDGIVTPIDNNIKTFEVIVRDNLGTPIEGVTIEGGIDWDAFVVRTNEKGVAILPKKAYKKYSRIYKTNYIPISISGLLDSVYIINRTIKKLEMIGQVEGKAVRFKQGELITLDYVGKYHVYNYNETKVNEIFVSKLNGNANAIRDIKMLGDTLWFTTHNSGVFCYSIKNSTDPKLILSVPIQGYLGSFAVKKSFIILGSINEPGPLRVIEYYDDGRFDELPSLSKYYVKKMNIIGNSVLIMGNNDCLPTVFDLSDPTKLKLLYNGLEPEYKSGFFYKNLAILLPQYAYGNINLDHRVLDFSIPSKPKYLPLINSDSWIIELASDKIAIGNYYYHNGTISILYGDTFNRFKTVATVSEGEFNEVGGAFPPFYIIGNKLWKLVDN